MTRMNWTATNDRRRIQRHGAECIHGGTPGTASPLSEVDRPPRRKRPHLTETVIVEKWWRTRGGKSIWVRLMPFKDFDLIDIRTWSQDSAGISQPGKGFACEAKHLPRLITALTKAAAKAQGLGLLDDDDGATE
jgi:hypothetical protein